MNGQDTGPDVPHVRLPPLRPSWAAVLIAAAAGVVLGAVLRPLLGRLAAEVSDEEGAARPMWPELHAAAVQQFELVDGAVPAGAVVYVGDSQTASMSLADLTRCSRVPVVNRGIAGDTTAGALQRVSGSFPPAASVCVLLIGFNDINRGERPARAAERVEALCRVLAEKHGVETIVLESVPTGRADVRDEMDAYNGLLATIPQRVPAVRFLDLAGRIWEHGGSAGLLWVDGVHFAAAGVAARLEIEEAFLREVRPRLEVTLRCIPIAGESP